MDTMSALGDAIRAGRLGRGMSQVELGREFGISKSAVNQWESGKNVPDQRKLAKLVQLIGLDPKVAVGLAEPMAASEAGDDGPSSLATARMMRIDPSAGRPDVPVWASAQAGDDGAIILTPDPIDYIRRSERMQGVKNPFAFYVVGGSMSPAIEHGDQVVVNPALPVRPGVDCVFIQEQPDGTRVALVKRLLRQTEKAWKVRQYEPKKDFDLPKSKWRIAYVVPEIRRGGL